MLRLWPLLSRLAPGARPAPPLELQAAALPVAQAVAAHQGNDGTLQ